MYSRVYVEITNICNMNCSFCHGHGRPARRMNEAEFSRVLDQLEGKTQYIYYHLMGEPLTHPQLPEFLQSIRRLGLAVKLDTKDENTIFVAQNTASSDGELVILAGDGPCGAVDLKITVPASSTVCFALDSACFKRVSGEDKGKVVMTGPATIGVAAFYAP